MTVTLLFSWEKTFVAELIAQVMARILILQYAHQYSITPITHPFVLYDNESAAAAFSKIPKSQKSLGLLGNILDVSCKGAYTCTAHHVCSHDCHPYTDYADSICTHMRDRLSESQVLRISDSQNLRFSESQTLGFSESQNLRFSESQNRRFSESPILRISDSQNLRIPDSQILRISESQNVRISGPASSHVPKPMSRYPSRVARAPHGLILSQDGAAASRNLFKYLPAPGEATFSTKWTQSIKKSLEHQILRFSESKILGI